MAVDPSSLKTVVVNRAFAGVTKSSNTTSARTVSPTNTGAVNLQEFELTVVINVAT